MKYVESGMEKSVPVVLLAVDKSAIEWYTSNISIDVLLAYFWKEL